MRHDRLCKSTSRASLLQASLGLAVMAVILPYTAYAETGSVAVNGDSYGITYDAAGIDVSGFDTDLQWPALIVYVDAPSSGTLDIIIERGLLDSLYGETDGDFDVLADDDFAVFNETETTPTHRAMTIQVPGDTDELLIASTGSDALLADGIAEQPSPAPAEDPESVGSTGPAEGAAGQVEDTPEEAEDAGTADDTPPTPGDAGTADDTPATECGPGTVFEDGVCVLDTRCGPGTVFEDGVCVLEPGTEPVPSPSKTPALKSLGGELVYGLVGAFIIAGGVGVVIGLMSRASRRRSRI